MKADDAATPTFLWDSRIWDRLSFAIPQRDTSTHQGGENAPYTVCENLYDSAES